MLSKADLSIKLTDSDCKSWLKMITKIIISSVLASEKIEFYYKMTLSNSKWQLFNQSHFRWKGKSVNFVEWFPVDCCFFNNS